jgi:hypothetical protein
MNRDDFRKNIVTMLSQLKPERKKVVVAGMVSAFEEALAEIGVRIKVKYIENEEFPQHMEEFIDMLKGMSGARVIKIGEDGVEEMSNDMKRLEKLSNGYDKGPKELGDTVKLINIGGEAYMHDFETKEQLSKNFELPEDHFEDKVAIVIETDTEFDFNCGHCDETHRSDLVIFFPDLKKSYHISSKFVKVI